MKADNLIKWLMPKEERFQALIEKDTQNLLMAARLFADIANTASLEERQVKLVEMRAREHDGDKFTRQILEALNSIFITPFDREDIRALAADLDNILDYLDSVTQYLVLFELHESPEALRQFATILVAMVEEIDLATGRVWNLANAKQIQASIVRISELENQGDSLYNTVIADLFKRFANNSVELMKWKEVYDGLEDACDGCKDFTHVLGNIVIKNA